MVVDRLRWFSARVICSPIRNHIVNSKYDWTVSVCRGFRQSLQKKVPIESHSSAKITGNPVICETRVIWLDAPYKRQHNLNLVTKTAGARLLASLFVALLLIATVAQVAHSCGFQSFDVRDGTQLRTDSPSATLCLTCLMAQSVAAIVLSIAFSSIFRRGLQISPPQMRPRSFLESFQLYVRPPPTL
jgi:hypothetical protein